MICHFAIELNYHTSKIVKIFTKMPLCCTKLEVQICENCTETEIFFMIGASTKALVRALGIDFEPNETFGFGKGYDKKADHAVIQRQAINLILILPS
jgi:hypothetical protein